MSLHGIKYNVLNAYNTFDGRVGVIVFEGEVFVLELEDVLHFRIDAHSRQFARLASELQMHLVEMIEVDVRVASRVNEIARLKSANLCHHHAKQGIRGDVEWHAKEAVRTPLIELQREFAVRHIELEEGVAGRQIHVLDVCHIPSRYDDASAVWIVLDGIDGLLNLVNKSAIIIRPGTPLIAVNVAEVARFGVCPFVPDAYTSLLQPLGICVAL